MHGTPRSVSTMTTRHSGNRFIAGELAVSGLSARLSARASQSTNAPAGPAYSKETRV